MAAAIPAMVHAREAQIGQRCRSQSGEQALMGLGSWGVPLLDPVEEVAELFWAHGRLSCLFC